LRDDLILAAAIEATDDPHPRDVLHARERPTALAAELLQDCPGVLDPGCWSELQLVTDSRDRGLKLF